MNQDYSPTELAQAERLEHYLSELAHKKIAPNDAAAEDSDLYRLARRLAVSTVQPRLLIQPTVKRFSLRKALFALTPLPLIAAAAVGYLMLRTDSTPRAVDVSTDLAMIDDSTDDLLALERDLDQSLNEIDLLTSTDYLDQL